MTMWALQFTAIYLPSYILYALVVISSIPTVIDLLSSPRLSTLHFVISLMLGALTFSLAVSSSWQTATIVYISITYTSVIILLLLTGISSWDASILTAHGLLNKLLPMILVLYTSGYRLSSDVTAITCLILLLRSPMTTREELLCLSASISPQYVAASVDTSSYTEIDALTSYLLLTIMLNCSTERCHLSVYSWALHILLVLSWAGIPTLSLSLLKLSWLSAAGNSGWQPGQLLLLILVLYRYARCLTLLLSSEAVGTDDLYRFWLLWYFDSPKTPKGVMHALGKSNALTALTPKTPLHPLPWHPLPRHPPRHPQRHL